MIRHLEWDSNFFKLKTGSIVINHQRELDNFEPGDYDLVYLFINLPEIEMPQHLKYPDFLLTDQKVTYQKKITRAEAPRAAVSSYKATGILPDKLLSLSVQAGHYSRFKTDSNIPLNKFEELYRLWITNSVDRKNADEVFVYSDGNEIDGLITVALKNEYTDIGLIAVDEKKRSLGIGKQLLSAAEYWSEKIMHTNIIRVVTQKQNSGACKFYEKNGYTIISSQYIYHWWNSNIIKSESTI